MIKLSFFILLFVAISISNGVAQQKLQSYNIDKSKITVSGISSGGIMATQYHFSHSSEVSGAGLFATVPYMCGFGGIAASLTCMTTPNLVNVPFLISEANVVAAAGNIDATSNIQGSRVYIFHGTKDSTVLPGSGENVKEVYQHYGAQVQTKFDIASQHAQPTDNYGAPCGSSAANDAWISNCGYQGAYEMLNYLHGGGLVRPNSSTVAKGELIIFDQSEFFSFAPSLSSMDTSGYIYVPSGCKDKQVSCPLHVAFHGCTQNKNTVGDSYVTKTGYIEAAELNNIVVLFPQTVANTLVGNPQGCWDWWGYLNQFFPTKEGNQVLATYRMQKRIIGE